MSKYEKPAEVLAHQSGQMETATQARENVPAHDFTTIAGQQQGEFPVYDLLPEGEVAAIPRRQLVAMTGLSDRMLRRQIADERRRGALIMSSVERGGYYRPARPEELRRFVQSMTSRGREVFAALTAARKALAEMEVADEQTSTSGT